MPSSKFIISIILIIPFLLLNEEYALGNTIKRVIIKGNVIDANTEKPVAGAKVFISGTTLMETTDDLGNFTIKVPTTPGVLVIHSKLHELKTASYSNKNKLLKIKLATKKTTHYKLQTVNNKKRSKNLRFFYSHFISDQNKGIEILNDSVLFFIRNNKEFTVFSKAPLIIRNKHLGYLIHTNINRFYIRKVAFPQGPATTLNDKSGMAITSMEEYSYYEKLEESNKKKAALYSLNRRQKYFGSRLHFLKSLYEGNTEKAGYQMISYPRNSIYPGIKSISKKLNQNTNEFAKIFMAQGDSIIVQYNHRQNIIAQFFKDNFDKPNIEKFWIYPDGKMFELFPNGQTINAGFVIVDSSSYFFNSVLSLPNNYSPYGFSD